MYSHPPPSNAVLVCGCHRIHHNIEPQRTRSHGPTAKKKTSGFAMRPWALTKPSMPVACNSGLLAPLVPPPTIVAQCTKRPMLPNQPRRPHATSHDPQNNTDARIIISTEVPEHLQWAIHRVTHSTCSFKPFATCTQIDMCSS